MFIGSVTRDFSRFVFSNFALTFLVVALTASGVVLIGKPKPLTAPVVVEALFAYFLLFNWFGLLYNFVLHLRSNCLDRS